MGGLLSFPRTGCAPSAELSIFGRKCKFKNSCWLDLPSRDRLMHHRQLTHRTVRTQDFPDFWGWADYGETAPYGLLFRPESPCRRIPLDLVIETASNSMSRLIAPGGRITVHWECRQWQHNVALSGSIPLQPALDWMTAYPADLRVGNRDAFRSAIPLKVVPESRAIPRIL
jgi:hypothetical protein